MPRWPSGWRRAWRRRPWRRRGRGRKKRRVSHRAPVVGGDRGPAHEHPQLQRPVEGGDEPGHPAQVVSVPHPGRGDHRQAPSAASRVADEGVGRPGVGEQPEGPLGLPVGHHRRAAVSSAAILRATTAACPGPLQGCRRHHRGRRDQGDRSPDHHRVGPPGERLARSGLPSRRDDDRPTAVWRRTAARCRAGTPLVIESATISATRHGS